MNKVLFIFLMALTTYGCIQQKANKDAPVGEELISLIEDNYSQSPDAYGHHTTRKVDYVKVLTAEKVEDEPGVYRVNMDVSGTIEYDSEAEPPLTNTISAFKQNITLSIKKIDGKWYKVSYDK